MAEADQRVATGTFRAALEGDRSASDAVTRIVRALAQRIASRRLPPGCRELDWEDVAQEALKRLFADSLERYRGTGSERNYLSAVVKRTAMDLARGSVRRRDREDRWAPVSVAVPCSHARIDVQRILSQMKEGCRELLRRAFLDDVSYADLAADLGIVESSVRSKVSRCIAAARTLIGRHR